MKLLALNPQFIQRLVAMFDREAINKQSSFNTTTSLPYKKCPLSYIDDCLKRYNARQVSVSDIGTGVGHLAAII